MTRRPAGPRQGTPSARVNHFEAVRKRERAGRILRSAGALWCPSPTPSTAAAGAALVRSFAFLQESASALHSYREGKRHPHPHPTPPPQLELVTPAIYIHIFFYPLSARQKDELQFWLCHSESLGLFRVTDSIDFGLVVAATCYLMDFLKCLFIDLLKYNRAVALCSHNLGTSLGFPPLFVLYLVIFFAVHAVPFGALSQAELLRQFSRSADPEQAEIQMAQTWESRGKRPVATSLLLLVPGLSNDGAVRFVWAIAWV